MITKFLGWMDFLSYGAPPTRANGYVFFIILLTSGRNLPLLVSGNSSGKKSQILHQSSIFMERGPEASDVISNDRTLQFDDENLRGEAKVRKRDYKIQ